MDLNKGISTPIAVLLIIIAAVVAGVLVWQFKPAGQLTKQASDYTTQQACEDAGYYWCDESCYPGVEEVISPENFEYIAFPAADGQFPIPDYEEKQKLMMDDFSGGSGEAEFFLLYKVKGDHREEIKDFYLKKLKKEGWKPKKNYSEVDVSKRERSLTLIFRKPEHELYKINLTIGLGGKLWPGDTPVKIIENWPTGFEYAKDLTPNSPFCRYFNKDFKDVLSSVAGQQVKLSGLHETPPGTKSKAPLRSFYYVAPNVSFSEASESEISDVLKEVENAFASNGYETSLDPEKNKIPHPLKVSKKISGKEYAFELSLLADGFIINYPLFTKETEEAREAREGTGEAKEGVQ